MFRWLKKWLWDIWFDPGPPVMSSLEEDSMYLSHDERIEKLKEMIEK